MIFAMVVLGKIFICREKELVFVMQIIHLNNIYVFTKDVMMSQTAAVSVFITPLFEISKYQFLLSMPTLDISKS